MFKLLLVLKLSVVLHVQTQSNWFYDMDDDWEISNRLTSDNPYYGWYKQAAKQTDMYGYAKHVGKINRGQFSNPELNMPADRAFGYQSDFNPNEVNSEAFNYKYRAKAVEDETILAKIPPYTYKMVGRSACDMCTCTVAKEFTATCSRNKNYKLTLDWSNPGGAENNIDLRLVPAFPDGDPCDSFDYFGNYYHYLSSYYYDSACGARFDENDYGDDETGEEFAVLTTVGQTKYQDYTYAVIAYMNEGDNYLSELDTTLTVEYDGVVEQTLTIPTRADSLQKSHSSYVSSPYYRRAYFFGCFRHQFGFVDTRGSGFYDWSTNVVDYLTILDSGLCKELYVLDN